MLPNDCSQNPGAQSEPVVSFGLEISTVLRRHMMWGILNFADTVTSASWIRPDPYG